MGDQLARAEDFEKKAEKKLNSWALFGSKYEDAADLYEKAANSYKLAKSCNSFNLIYMEFSVRILFIDDCHYIYSISVFVVCVDTYTYYAVWFRKWVCFVLFSQLLVDQTVS